MSSMSLMRRGWLAQPWVREVAPFVTSVVIHLAVLAIGAIFFLGVSYVQNQAVHQEQGIVPPAMVVKVGALGDMAQPGFDNDRNHAALQDRFKDSGTPDGWADKKGSRLNLRAADGGGAGDVTDATIGLGAGGGFGIGKAGHANGVGNDLGSGQGDGGPLAMFGTLSGGGSGAVFVPSTGARRIAFVCDASGSMVSKFSTLRRELSKTVHLLTPAQSFSVIFFQQQTCTSTGRDLLIATPASKAQADAFLERITPRAETNPIPALELAFAQKPDVIYLLTDGDFPDNQAVLNRIRELSRNAHVKINTIAFVNDADTDTAFVDLLKKIAAESAGIFRDVREGDI